MRIGIDARELHGHTTGVGRYLAGLLREWSADDISRRHEFVLYVPGPIGLTLDGRRFAVRQVDGSPGTWWEQVLLPRATAHDHLDVFFAPGYTAPLRLTVPLVLTVHDVSFLAHPEWFGTREGIRRRWLTRRSASRADEVITISEFSRREIATQLGVPAARVHVILIGVTPPLQGRISTRPGTSPIEGGRVLYVGSIFNRRHIPDLIRGFARLARQRADVSLDLVGENRTCPHEDLPRAIRAEGIEGRVRWHQYAPEIELQALYGAASAFAFLSEYEGSGLTPVEALAAGLPPVLLDTDVARETCGEAALYVAAHDPAAIGRALETALFDRAARERVLAAAPGVLARYSWQRTARETMTVIENAANAVLNPAP
jgi:glycosyltransferase involved in cell wall biosynthesis